MIEEMGFTTVRLSLEIKFDFKATCSALLHLREYVVVTCNCSFEEFHLLGRKVQKFLSLRFLPGVVC